MVDFDGNGMVMCYCNDNDQTLAKVYKDNDSQLYRVDFLDDKGIVVAGMGARLISRVILFAEDECPGTYWVIRGE